MEIPTAYAGDIVSVAGFAASTVTYTLNKSGNTQSLPVKNRTYDTFTYLFQII